MICLDFFFPLQAKKTKLVIFHLWHERMEGCFFTKFPLILVLTLISGFGFRKFQMDEVGWISWALGSRFFSKVVFWLLVLLTHSESKSWGLWWRGFTWERYCVSTFLAGLVSDIALHKNVPRCWYPTANCGCWRVDIHPSVCFSPRAVCRLICSLSFISIHVGLSVSIILAKHRKKANLSIVGTLPSLGNTGG